MKVEGTVSQITPTEAGEVRLALTWPRLSPVTFRGVINHQENFAVIKPIVTLEVSDTIYSFDGEVCDCTDIIQGDR